MKRNGENVARVSVRHFWGCSGANNRRRFRRQWLARSARAPKDRSRPISVMNVTIHGHGGADLLIPLHGPDCHGYVINHAKSFAMIGEGVVKAATYVYADATLQGAFRRQYRSACCQPECLHQLP